jgi:hypothetical protein
VQVALATLPWVSRENSQTAKRVRAWGLWLAFAVGWREIGEEVDLHEAFSNFQDSKEAVWPPKTDYE